jgi:Domain of unknown function DUF11
MNKYICFGALSISLFILSLLWANDPESIPRLQTAPTLITSDTSTETQTVVETTATATSSPLVMTRAYKLIDENADGIEGGVADKISLTLTIENVSNSIINNVVIDDDYPEIYISGISNPYDGSDNQNSITWIVGTMEPSLVVAKTYEVLLKNKYPNTPISLEFTATISSDGFSQKEEKFTIPLKLPNLNLNKTFKLVSDLNGNSNPDPGDTIQYSINLENKGNSDATNVIITDDYNEKLLEISNISGGGQNDGKVIQWMFDQVKAESQGLPLIYKARLIEDAFNSGSIEINNQVTISSDQTEINLTSASIHINVPTPTTTPNPTPTPTLTPTAIPAGPQSGLFANTPVGPLLLVGLLSLVAMGVLTYATVRMCPQPTAGQDDKNSLELHKTGLEVLREGIFVIIIIAAILMLALGQGIREDGAISILSAIVGYLFGRSTGMRSSSGGK